MINQATLHGLHVLLNVVDFFAWFSACGLIMVRAGLMPPAAFKLPDMAGAWRQSMSGCLAVLTMTGSALLLVRALEMSGLPLAQATNTLSAVLLHTHFGLVWTAHLFLLVLLATTMLLPTRMAILIAACTIGLLAFTYSAVSHASDRGDFTLSELIDLAHVIATSIWSGGIIASLFFAFPLLQDYRALLTQTILRLSCASAIALAGVVVTGLCNAFLRLRHLDDLLITDYGHVLAAKVALVGGMSLLGAYNRFFSIPRLKSILNSCDGSVYLSRVACALVCDVILITLVLFAAAMLMQGMPPASLHSMRNMHM